MCLTPKAPAQLPPPTPAPVDPPAPLVSPEDAIKNSANSTASVRKSSSRSKLRLDVGGTAGTGSGLFLPES